MSYKARIDFTGEREDALIPIGVPIDKLLYTDNAAVFLNPPVTQLDFSAHRQDFAYKLGLAQSDRGVAAITAKDGAKLIYLGDLRVLGGFVNTIARGDKTIVEQSGFPGYETHHPQHTDVGMASNVTFVPQNMRFSQGGGSGRALFRWESDGSRTGCELWVTTGAPDDEAGYVYRGSFTGGKADIGGFTPGTKIWGKVRKIGKNAETGPWSDPATGMVT